MTEPGDRKHADEAAPEPGDVRAPEEDVPSPAEEEEREAEERDEWGSVPPFEGFDAVDLRESLRKALRPPSGSVAPSLLTGVQRKIRTRSRGKFYGDGWSTARTPRSTYLITSLLMLVLMVLVFLVLVPWVGGGLPFP